MKKLAVIIIFIVVLVGGGYFVYQKYLAKVISPQAITTDTADGFKVSQGSVTTDVKDLPDPASFKWGVAIYPGAKASTAQGSAIQQTYNGAQKLTTGTFITSDSIGKVVAYYTEQLGPSPKINQFTIAGEVTKSIAPNAKNSPSVGISTSGGKTSIQIVSIN